MSGRHRLGSWTCPSGNSCDVDLVRVSDGALLVTCAWDEPPPLHPTDEAHYLTIIRPAVIRLVREYEGLAGEALMVALR